MPLRSYCCCRDLWLRGLEDSRLLIVLPTLYAICNCVSLKSLVIAHVSLPK